MELILVRHGESLGNAEGRMQGHSDYPLTDRGRAQAKQLGGWLGRQGITWSRAYASPLARAWETAEIVTSLTGGPAVEPEPLLKELMAGALEGRTLDEIVARFPRFGQRHVTELGDFSEFGGESYDAAQARARSLRDKLETSHRSNGERVLLVGHGGFHFQLAKSLICEPVPRVCIVRMTNCAATLIRLRERYETYMGELIWHVPVDLMGEGSRETGLEVV
jgi:broad specificity phosphatase PhoE